MKAYLTKTQLLYYMLLPAMLLLPAFSFAQGVTNNGAAIIVNGTNTTTSNVYIKLNGTTTNYVNQSTGIISCSNIGYDINADGSLTSNMIVGGNWTDNASTTGITGTGLTVIFNNTLAAQTIGGTNSTSFFNLICQGSSKTFSGPPSSTYALQVNQNYSVGSAVGYGNISAINIGKHFLGSASINSGSIPVTIGDDYLNTATGYSVTGAFTYNGSATSASPLMVGALNYTNLNILSADGVTKTAPVSAATTVAGILTVADKCTLQAGGNLTLLSTVNATASVAALTGTAAVTGNVNAQRFVTGSYGRSYRLISSPVYTSTGFYTIAPLIGYTPITGPNPGTSSFDASNTNNSSVWMYREGDPYPANAVIKDSDYKGIYSLTENIPVGTGLLFFNRGNRSTNLNTKLRGPTFPTPEDNAVVFTGTLNQGTISVNVPQNNINNFTASSPYAKESPGSSLQSAYYYKYNASYAPVANLQRTNWYGMSGKAGDQNSDGFNLIGNPYASTIDLDLVTFGSDISTNVYVYNPINKQFSYYVKGSGGATTDGAGANRYIASGQGFFARCNTVGSTNAGVTFAETNKVSNQITGSTSPMLLMSAHVIGDFDSRQNITGPSVKPNLPPSTDINSSIMLRLQTDSVNYDGVGIFFNKNWSANYDKDDAPDLDGISPTVYLSSYSADHSRLAINRMPAVSKQMRIKLYVDAASTVNQQLQITSMANVAPKYNVYVVDHHQKDSVLINQNTPYNFNIDRSDTTTNGGNRLELVFKLNPQAAYKLLNFNGKIAIKGVVLSWTTLNEASYTVFTIEKSTDGGKTFSAIGSVASNSSGVYTFTDNSVDNGTVLYRLKQAVLDDQSYSENVQIKFNILNVNAFFVYPNPATSFVQLFSSNAFKGQGEIRITNMTGLLILKLAVTSSNANALRIETTSLKPGIYIITLTDAYQNQVGQVKFIKL